MLLFQGLHQLFRVTVDFGWGPGQGEKKRKTKYYFVALSRRFRGTDCPQPRGIQPARGVCAAFAAAGPFSAAIGLILHSLAFLNHLWGWSVPLAPANGLHVVLCVCSVCCSCAPGFQPTALGVLQGAGIF